MNSISFLKERLGKIHRFDNINQVHLKSISLFSLLITGHTFAALKYRIKR